MSTKVGDLAESAAAEYLKKIGYQIVDRNWRTRVCEIDIIAKKSNVIYLVEVKYRSGIGQGSGIDYITPSKLKQMQFAASCWVADHGYNGDYYLSAIEVSGDFRVTQFIESIT